MIHEAYDLGVNVFDVYDEEKGSSLAGSYQYEPIGRQIKPFKNNRFDAGQQVILYCEIEKRK